MTSEKMKLKLFITTILSFLISTYVFAERIDLTKCEKSRIQAKVDLKNKKCYFMLQGGIVPIHFAGKEKFEQKYSVKFFDLGCMIPINLCIEHYNAEVAKYLDQKYGKVWRKEIK